MKRQNPRGGIEVRMRKGCEIVIFSHIRSEVGKDGLNFGNAVVRFPNIWLGTGTDQCVSSAGCGYPMGGTGSDPGTPSLPLCFLLGWGVCSVWQVLLFVSEILP